ncbi:MAG: hypothetical protein ACRCST_09760, partial [Turicibacter sp.]
MRKLSDQHKIVICYLGLLIMLILMGNSNNVPEPFAERIFKPIMGDGWAVHYAGILIIFGIYYCLKQLNKIRQNYFINTFIMRVGITLLLFNVFSSTWGYGIQIYKGFFNDLNSIYLDRGKTSVQLQGHERVLNIDGVIAFKNYSNEPQSFDIKIKIPAFINKFIDEEYVTLENKIELNPKESQTIYLSEQVIVNTDTQYSFYNGNAFEYTLVNNQDEV